MATNHTPDPSPPHPAFGHILLKEKESGISDLIGEGNSGSKQHLKTLIPMKDGTGIDQNIFP
jgi:hypothetical protein